MTDLDDVPVEALARLEQPAAELALLLLLLDDGRALTIVFVARRGRGRLFALG